MQRKTFLLFGLLSASCLFGCLSGLTNNSKVVNASGSFNDYVNPQNWKNLPGYQYKTAGIPTDNDEKFPAEVTFPTSVDDVGINTKFKGYYASGTGDEDGNMFAGLVYKQKVKLEDLSITFTINNLGANSAIGDDGWISICFLTKPNLFSTTNPLLNMGSIALLRTQTRSITVYDHEIGMSSTGEKYANFATGTNVSLDLDTYPSCEGSTIRVSYEKESTAASTKYFLVVEQLDFSTGEVISSKRTSNPLIHSDDYVDQNGEGYFAFSASTDNFEKKWDISIKNFNGVDLGTKSDVAPLSPEQKAEIVNDLIGKLNISTYCTVDGDLTNEGKEYYSPTNKEIDIDDLITQLLTHLNTFTSDDANALANISRASSMFESPDAYVSYIKKCANNILNNYEELNVDILISRINNLVSQLPKLNEVNLTNEQKVTNIINELQICFFAMKDKATQKYGADNKQKLWDDIIVKYSDKLDDIKFEKFVSLVDALPTSVTKDNLKQTIFDLVPAELIYEYFEAKIDDVETRKPEMYKTLVAKKQLLDDVRSKVDGFKSTDRIYVEDLEAASAINYKIYYLADNPTTDDVDYIFEILTSYAALSDDGKSYVEESEKLFVAACKALDATIDELPSVDGLTKENYLKNGYDSLITDTYKKYTQLKNLYPSTNSKMTKVSKLLDLVEKLDTILNPLSSKTIMSKDIKANEELVISFVDLFNNYDGRDYEVTSNYGKVDMLNETVTLKFEENGEFQVSVTITDKKYGDTATNTFKVTVTGAQEKKQGGCGGSIIAASALVSMVSILGFALICKKREK